MDEKIKDTLLLDLHLELGRKVMRYIVFIKDIMQFFFEKMINKKHYQKYILMFHMVSDDEGKWYDEEYSISLKKFKYMVERLKEMGYEFGTIDDILQDKEDKILLTFDDVFREIYDGVFPYLRDNEIPFVIFQTWEHFRSGQYLNDDMIEEMIRYKGCQLGSHGLVHERFSEMNNAKSVSNLAESKRKLENRFKITIKSIAYPYGSFSSIKYRDIKNAKKFGYEIAFGTVNKGISRYCYNKFYLPRINVNEANAEKILERCKI